MFERLTVAARTAITASTEEAGRRGDRRIGTDSLLLGLLHDPLVSSVLGTTLDRARATAYSLDGEALSAIGVDTAGFTPPAASPKSWRTPFTSGARTVISRALKLAGDTNAKSIGPNHLLLALLEREAADPAAALLAALNVDYNATRAHIYGA